MRYRRNPPRELKAPHLVMVKRFDLDPDAYALEPWRSLFHETSEDGEPAVAWFTKPKALALAKNPPADTELHVGDLIAVVHFDHFASADDHADHLFVVGPSGVLKAPRKELHVNGSSWGAVAPWTSWGQSVYEALHLAHDVDKRRSAMVSVECARRMIDVLREAGYGLPRPGYTTDTERLSAPVRMAEARCLRRVSAFDLSAWVLENGEDYKSKSRADLAALHVALAAYARLSFVANVHARGALALSAEVIASNVGGGWEDVRQRFAPVILRWIPLPVLLLSRLGHPEAIPFEASARAILGADALAPGASATRPNPHRRGRR